jgi:hypothetical protein
MELKRSIRFAFDRLNRIIPGIMPETYYCVTAATSVGKTQLTKFLFVRKAIEWAMANNFNLHIKYFALEESEKDFFDTFRIALLKKRFNVKLDLYGIQGFRGPLSDEMKTMLEKIEPEIEILKSYVDVVDTIGNPTGIFKYVKAHASKHGKHFYQNLDNGEIKLLDDFVSASDRYRYHHYEPNDPNSLTIVIVDHINLLSTEAGASSLGEAMQKLSSEYMLNNVVKRYKYAVVNVHQQAMAGEGLDYYKAGLEKLYPTMDKLGDNKLVGRDYHITFGLFNPTKFPTLVEKSDLSGYNLSILKKNFRTLHILKHRKGEDGLVYPLFFDGGGQSFSELGLPASPDLNNQYKIISEKRANNLI